MENGAEAEMQRQVRVTTEGKLMSSVESGRSAETTGMIVINRGIDEILIGRGGRGARGSGERRATIGEARQ